METWRADEVKEARKLLTKCGSLGEALFSSCVPALNPGLLTLVHFADAYKSMKHKRQ